MHEVSLMEQTLAIAFNHAQQEGATRIHRLRLRIGAMAGVVPEALLFAFDVAIAGTMAQGAILEIETVPVICYCRTCQANFTIDDIIYQCPNCGQISADTKQGKEIELASLEIS